MQSASDKPAVQSQINPESAAWLNSFFTEGAILQTAADSYKLFIGPFSEAVGSDLNQDLLYKPDFWDFSKNERVQNDLLKAYKIVDLNKEKLISLFAELSLVKAISEIRWEPADKNAFQSQFDWLKLMIQQNEISKGLPITEQIGTNFKAENKFQIVQNILLKKSEQFLYGFWNQSSGFIGFSPEILIKSEKKQFSTMALAGTWNKQNDTPNDFNDLKIKKEHQIVVEDIIKQLSDEKLISKSQTQILELEFLFHLQTNFMYESEDIKSCIDKLHPTAALGLYPRSKKLFSEFQKFNLQKARKNFGAPFGYFSLDQCFIVVAIRNIYWADDKISIFSGCGVTDGSDFETEWSELEAKRNAVKKTFGLNL